MAIGPNQPFATVGHMIVSYSRVFFDIPSARHRLRAKEQGGAVENPEGLRLSVLWSLLLFTWHTCSTTSVFLPGFLACVRPHDASRHHTIRTVQSSTVSAFSEPATRRSRVQATAGNDQLPHLARCVA